MSHEVETMAFANQVPWHGIGTNVSQYITVPEMLVASGLDWKVERRETYMKKDDGSFVKVPNKRVLVRDSDERILTHVSDRWKPVQNSDALEFFTRYCEAGSIKLETAGSLKDGKIIWCLAKIGHDFETTPGDRTNGYILFFSPHEVGKATSLRTTTIRVVCANTMARALSSQGEIHWSQNHLSEFNFDAAREAVEQAHSQLRIAEKESKALAGLNLSTADQVRLLSKIFEIDMTEEMIADPSQWSKHVTAVMHSVEHAPGAAPGSAWGLLQGYNHWADHEIGYSPDNRMTQAWLGKRADTKLQINKNLLEMADFAYVE